MRGYKSKNSFILLSPLAARQKFCNFRKHSLLKRAIKIWPFSTPTNFIHLNMQNDDDDATHKKREREREQKRKERQTQTEKENS